MAAKKDISFQSPAELADLLEGLGLVLHQRNRVTGESNFVWQLAELIRGTGRMCELIAKDAEVAADFGDGYTPGRLSRDKQLTRALELLKQRV